MFTWLVVLEAGCPKTWNQEPVNFFLPSHPTMEEKTCKKKKVLIEGNIQEG